MSEKHHKYSIEQVKKLSPKFLLKIIQKAKNFLKKDETFIKMCKEYNVSTEIIEYIPMYFDDLEVSATTQHGIVYFNYKLLCDGDFSKDFMYAIHESGHVLQQYFNDKATKGANDGDYLDNPYEIESFQNQLEFMNNHLGEKETEKYVDNLLDYHGLDEEDVNDKKEELMEKV